MKLHEKEVLARILEHIERIDRVIEGREFGEFVGDATGREAIFYNFTAIGRCAESLPKDFRLQHGSVNWKLPAELMQIGLSNYRLAYGEVLKLVRTEVKELREAVQTVHDSLPDMPPFDGSSKLREKLAGMDAYQVTTNGA